MMPNFFDGEIRKLIAKELANGQLRETNNCSEVFRKLSENFPSLGSKIDWSKLPESISHTEVQPHLQKEACISFIKEIQKSKGLSGSAIYVGDSATDIVLEGSFSEISKVIPILIEFPQHHYVIGCDFTWCICLSMEGDLNFGRSRDAGHRRDHGAAAEL